MSESDEQRKQKHQTLFMHLVMMMSSSAMQHMGKTVNPMTGKTDLDLDGAAFAIDMLEMIEARTAGNLDKDEDRLLKSQLANLRLNFVEASESAKKDPSAKPEKSEDQSQTASPNPETEGSGPQPQPPAEPACDQTATDASAENPDEKSKSARFHKSYG